VGCRQCVAELWMEFSRIRRPTNPTGAVKATGSGTASNIRTSHDWPRGGYLGTRGVVRREQVMTGQPGISWKMVV
jgi:hypothetical protein